MSTEEGPEAAGINAIAAALAVPLIAIINNAEVSSTQVLAKIDVAPERTAGFNVVTNQVEDLVKVGILDSVKMLKGGLEIAFSNARAMLELASGISRHLITPLLAISIELGKAPLSNPHRRFPFRERLV